MGALRPALLLIAMLAAAVARAADAPAPVKPAAVATPIVAATPVPLPVPDLAATPQSAPTPAPNRAAPMLPWLGLDQKDAMELHFKHDISQAPGAKTPAVALAETHLNKLQARMFGGEVEISAEGLVRNDVVEDLDSTVTMRRLDAQALLKFLGIARAGEITATLDGEINIKVKNGRFTRVKVLAGALPGTAALSRAMLVDIFTRYLGEAVKPAQINATLDKFYGAGTKMIPLDNLSVTGDLGKDVLALKLPVRNKAVQIELEPRVDAALLWDVWKRVKSRGMQNMPSWNSADVKTKTEMPKAGAKAPPTPAPKTTPKPGPAK